MGFFEPIDTVSGILGDAAGVIGGADDISKLLGHEKVPAEPSVDNFSGAMDIAGGVAKVADGNWGGFGDVTNGLMTFAAQGASAGDQRIFGAIGGLSQFAANEAEALYGMDEESKTTNRSHIDEDTFDNPFWNAHGDAKIGLAHGVLSLMGPAGKPADAVLSLAELGLDSAGAMSGQVLGEDYKFGAGQVAGGIDHFYNEMFIDPIMDRVLDREQKDDLFGPLVKLGVFGDQGADSDQGDSSDASVLPGVAALDSVEEEIEEAIADPGEAVEDVARIAAGPLGFLL